MANGLAVRGLIAACGRLHTDMQALVNKEITHTEISTLHNEIAHLGSDIEKICKKRKANIADLAERSYRAYLWLKFFEERNWLERHMEALRRIHTLSKNSYAQQDLLIRFENSSFLFRGTKKKKVFELTIHEGFILADDGVYEEILAACFSKKRNALHKVRDFGRSAKYKLVMKQLWVHSAQSRVSTMGEQFDLQQLYDAINQQYFKGSMQAPRMVWSTRSSIRRLGYYNPDTDTISISHNLDQESVPRFVVEYVLYHELLHKKLGLKPVNARRMAHTGTFKRMEKQFERYQEAEDFIRQMGKNRKINQFSRKKS